MWGRVVFFCIGQSLIFANTRRAGTLSAMTTTTAPVRITTTGASGNWHAAIRQGSRTLATCGHSHRNRNSGDANARWCGRQLIMAARGNELFNADRFIGQDVRAASVARGLGARITDDEARERAAAVVATWRDLIHAHDVHIEAEWAQRSAGWSCGCCRPA